MTTGRWGTGILRRILRRPDERVRAHSLRRIAFRLWGTGHWCYHRYARTAERRRGRPIALSDREWSLLRNRADDVGMSAAELVRMMCGLFPPNIRECPVADCRTRVADDDERRTHPYGCRCYRCDYHRRTDGRYAVPPPEPPSAE